MERFYLMIVTAFTAGTLPEVYAKHGKNPYFSGKTVIPGTELKPYCLGADYSNLIFSGAVTQDPVIADSGKTSGKHMEQEPPDKFRALQCHDLVGMIVPVIFIAEGDGRIRHFKNAAVGDGNPVGISSEIRDRIGCSIESFFYKWNPFFVI